jgi:hypothetical protein
MLPCAMSSPSAMFGRDFLRPRAPESQPNALNQHYPKTPSRLHERILVQHLMELTLTPRTSAEWFTIARAYFSPLQRCGRNRCLGDTFTHMEGPYMEVLAMPRGFPGQISFPSARGRTRTPSQCTSTSADSTSIPHSKMLSATFITSPAATLSQQGLPQGWSPPRFWPLGPAAFASNSPPS